MQPDPFGDCPRTAELDAALSLLDDGGPNAASIRGIAAEVGVAPNAVDTNFPDKAAVVKALVERLLGDVDHAILAEREQPWRQRLEALALDERLLELLADAGLKATDAARAANLLIVYVFGSIALEVADLHQPGPLPPESERIDNRLSTFSATPAEHFPRTAAAAATMAGYISTEQYLWGLGRVLDGITAGAAARSRRSGG